MKAMERRLARLGPAIARLHPPKRPPIDENRLTADEWAEAARIGAITKGGGLAVLTDADLDLAICLAQKINGEEISHCFN